jgi:hypothetical protein
MSATAFSECEGAFDDRTNLYGRPKRLGMTFDTTNLPAAPFDGRVILTDINGTICYANLGHDYPISLDGMGGNHPFKTLLFNYVPNGESRKKRNDRGERERKRE